MRTLVLIKPDAVERSLIGAILKDIEAEDFKILDLSMHMSVNKVVEHYLEHREREGFAALVDRMSRSPLVAVVVQFDIYPEGTIEVMRTLVGPYRDRVLGTLRHKYAVDDMENSLHASDSVESMYREMEIWFPGE